MNIDQVSPLDSLLIENKQWREKEKKKKRMNAGLHSKVSRLYLDNQINCYYIPRVAVKDCEVRPKSGLKPEKNQNANAGVAIQ